MRIKNNNVILQKICCDWHELLDDSELFENKFKVFDGLIIVIVYTAKMSEKKEFISTRKGIKYLDLFAGAGGFSGKLI